MQSTSEVNEVKYAVIATVSPPYSSLVAQADLPVTSGQAANDEDHFIPKRLWSRSASWLMWSPWPDSQMIWAIVQPAGCP